MKLFIVTCIKENQAQVQKIFKQSKISAFSAADITGFKDNQPASLLQDWFASGDEKFDSVVVFSFTGTENTDQAIELIKKYNEESATDFPIRAFVVPVEKASYQDKSW